MGRHIATITAGALIAALGFPLLLGEPAAPAVALAILLRGAGLVIAMVGVVAIGVRSGMKGLLETEWAQPFRSERVRESAVSRDPDELPPLERDVAYWLRSNPASDLERIQAGTGHVQKAVRQALEGLRAKGLLVEHSDGGFSVR